MQRNLQRLEPAIQAKVISLAHNPLPLWSEDGAAEESGLSEKWQPLSDQLAASDAFVIVTPEWSGMVPAGLKNLFLLTNKNELAHKPALIVAVSSGIGGSYPIAELRTSSYKNTRICYIPEQVIIRQVNNMLKGEKAQEATDENLRRRIDYSLKILLDYAKAFRNIRDSANIDFKSYPFGM